MQSSFEQLTFEGSRISTGVANYHSLMSISGLIPHHAPGSYFLEADSRKSSPTLLSGISASCSYIVTAEYEEGSAEFVQSMRDAYLEVREKSAALVSALIAQAMAKQRGGPDKPAAVEEGKGATSTALSGATNPSVPRENTTLSEASTNQNTQLAAAVNKARSELDSATLALRKALRPNYLITTWASEDAATADANVKTSPEATSTNGLSAAQQRKRKGVLVLGGLRVRSLVIGQDFKHMLHELRKREYGEIQTVAQMSNVGITTLVIEAQHVAYISEMDLLQEVTLDFNISKADLINKLTPEVQLQVASAITTAESVTNSAVLSAPKKIFTEDFNFSEGQHSEIIRNAMASSKNYIQVYVVRANLNAAGIALLGRNVERLPKCVGKEVDKIEVQESVRG
jgi:hypothetical protein